VIETVARYSVDGAWIWYSAGSEWPAVDLWRVRSDGTGAPERMGPGEQPPPGFSYNLYWQAIAYADNKTVGYLDGGWFYHLLDLTTGKDIAVGGSAHGPHYSPVRDLVAYVPDDASHAVWVMRPDGSGARQIVDSPDIGAGSVDWSPDGQWMLSSSTSAALINYATGLVLPLRFSCEPGFAVWRPGT
jgi:hypothetical protein